MSHLDERTLQEIAPAANGENLRASNARSDLGAVCRRIEKMEKKEFGALQLPSLRTGSSILWRLASVLLILELILSEKRNRFLSRFAIFAPKE